MHLRQCVEYTANVWRQEWFHLTPEERWGQMCQVACGAAATTLQTDPERLEEALARYVNVLATQDDAHRFGELWEAMVEAWAKAREGVPIRDGEGRTLSIRHLFDRKD
jgi:hypothetical protein